MRPTGLGVRRWLIGQANRLSAVRGDGIHVAVALGRGVERNPLPVRRPSRRGRSQPALKERQLPRAQAAGVANPDLLDAGAPRRKCQPRTIGRKAGPVIRQGRPGNGRRSCRAGSANRHAHDIGVACSSREDQFAAPIPPAHSEAGLPRAVVGSPHTNQSPQPRSIGRNAKQAVRRVEDHEPVVGCPGHPSDRLAQRGQPPGGDAPAAGTEYTSLIVVSVRANAISFPFHENFGNSSLADVVESVTHRLRPVSSERRAIPVDPVWGF